MGGNPLHGLQSSSAEGFQHKRKPVPDHPESPASAERRAMVDRLVREANITEAEATDLVRLLGTDWPSLIREANLLRKGL